MALRVSLLAFLVPGFAPISAGAADADADFQDDARVVPTFTEFIQMHGRTYVPGTPEYARRQALYEQRSAEVERQNSQPDRPWTAGINKLADRTAGELAQLRGYRPQAREAPGRGRIGFLSKAARSESLESLPRSFSWRSRLQAMQEVRDQSSCGSCWAFASATVLRAHSELYQTDRKFSVQQIVACTPNLMQCGGDGGCKGATAELAMEYVMKNGCVTESDFPYSAVDTNCPAPSEAKSLLSTSPGTLLQPTSGGASFGMLGYAKIPENKLEPVMRTLVEHGPVAVSLSAGSAWNQYHSGIMTACARDAVIDHAVTLVGFGEDRGTKYWLIQNSWGKRWGEKGFIRLHRHDNDEESRYCGWDRNPEIGSGCKGGPPKVWICGTCGILYDVVAPNFQLSKTGLWATSSKVAARDGVALLETNMTERSVSLHTVA